MAFEAGCCPLKQGMNSFGAGLDERHEYKTLFRASGGFPLTVNKNRRFYVILFTLGMIFSRQTEQQDRNTGCTTSRSGSTWL